MKQTLQLRLGQTLTMTPQLQQAIRLLQLSTLELQTEIQQALDSNPMLDTEEEAAEPAPDRDNGATEEFSAERESAERDKNDGDGDGTDDSLSMSGDGQDIPDELPVDSAWDDIYEPNYTGSAAPADDNNRDFFELQGDAPESLHDHLLEQLHLKPLSDTDMEIAAALIDSVDDNGYLAEDLEIILDGLNRERNGPDQELLQIDEVEAVLCLVQSCDPPGVAARDLRESMLIQLGQLDPATPGLADARRLVDEQLDALAARDFNKLKRALKLDEPELQQAINLAQSLNPRPGSQLAGGSAQYIVPDVFVRKQKGVWRVELNPEIAPRLCINALYSSMVRRADKSDDNTFMRNHLQEARWFIKSLQSRNETLLRVATAIVKRQRAFLEYGEEAMKPMILRDVAEQLEMHESTISRVTTQKFMHTPRGIFEFKYFFSSHVSTADGGECSATAIRAMLRKLIAEEDSRKPLSDSKIASILGEKGIQVARRTVAKYREAMAIPPSNERKRL